MVLALPVAHPHLPQHMLLRVGYTVERRILPRLAQLGVRFLWVRCPSLDFLSEYVSPPVLACQAELFQEVTEAFSAMQTQASARISYETYCQTIGHLVGQLVENPKAAIFLDDLASPEMASLDLLRHSSTVTYISLLMGLKLEGYLVRQRKHISPERAREVTNLGVGAMLHDLGITQLPQDACQRYQSTHDEGDPAWQTHPSLGYRLVHDHVEPSAATVVLNHHQRFDGQGYAGPAAPALGAERIHVFARIVAAADYFDHQRRLSQPRPCPTVRVLAEMLTPANLARFDPVAIIALLSVVPPYPPGSLVQLSDGHWAVAIEHRAVDPCRPVIQIVPEPASITGEKLPKGPVIDLAQASRQLHVAHFEGQDVSAYNFDLPGSLATAVAGLAYA